MSETKRGLVRITANYTGLFMTMILGLTLVPMLLAIGNDLFGAVALLGSTVGLAGLLKDIVGSSLIRELGVAYHQERDRFLETYNTAILLSAVGAVITMIVFVVLLLFLIPVLNFPEGMTGAAQWFVFFKSIELVVVVVLGPTYNLYLVEERLIAFNGWRVAMQASYPAAAGIVLLLAPGSETHPLVLFGVFSAALTSAVALAACGWMVKRYPDLWPSPRRASRAAMHSIIRIGGWNAAVITATNLHIRLDALVMNVFFGLLGNQVFGAATILSSYTRRLAAGMTTGLDAVSTRLSSNDSDKMLKKLIHHATRLHGLAVFPTAAFVVAMAEPFTRLWLGRRLDDVELQIPLIVMLVGVLVVGRSVRSISDAWVRILYGAGHIRRYAPLIVAGGLLNPLLAVGLAFALPEPWNYAGPALSYSIILLVAHGVLLPIIGARSIGVGTAEVFSPLLCPAVLTAVSAPVLLMARGIVDQWSWLHLLASLALFGSIYGLLTLIFFLSPDERRRLVLLGREMFART